MTTGRQWIATDFGGPEVLQLREVDVPPPGPGEVTIGTRASGMNPADYKHFGPGQDHHLLPLTVGYEAAGVITAVGPGTSIATGGGAVGDEVIAFQILGGYSSALNVRASDVFAKPGTLDFAQAANLLLASTTAAELLATAGVDERDPAAARGGRRGRPERAPAGQAHRRAGDRHRQQGQLRHRRELRRSSRQLWRRPRIARARRRSGRHRGGPGHRRQRRGG